MTNLAVLRGCRALTCRLLAAPVPYRVDVGDGDLTRAGRQLAAVAVSHHPLGDARLWTDAAAVAAFTGTVAAGHAGRIGTAVAAGVAGVALLTAERTAVKAWRRHTRRFPVVHGADLVGGVGTLPAACWTAAVTEAHPQGYGGDLAELLLTVRGRLPGPVAEVADGLAGTVEGTVGDVVGLAAAVLGVDLTGVGPTLHRRSKTRSGPRHTVRPGR